MSPRCAEAMNRLSQRWSIALPGGVLVRAIALKRDADGSQIAFAIVAALTTLVLLLAWRGIASLATQRRG